MAILKDLVVQSSAKVIGSIYGASFIKVGGTSSQFLKADGSVDNNAYALASAIPTVNDAILTVSGSGLTISSASTFTANASSNQIITITHPTVTSSYNSGLYKITTNSTGHVTNATSVTASDITGLTNWPSYALTSQIKDATLTVKGDGIYLSVGDSNAGDTFTANASSSKTITVTHDKREERQTNSTVTLDLTRDTLASRQLSIITHTFDNAGHETSKDTKTVTFLQITDTKVTQAVTASSNTSWRPLILGASYSDAATFTISNITSSTYATHLAKFKPNTGVLAIVGLNKMETNGKVTAGSNNVVWNTNGTTTTLATVATTGDYNDLASKPSIPAAQVNSDWNATSGVAEILNKPSIVTSITTATGSYNGVSNASGVVSFNIPSDTNHLTNGAGFITASDDTKVKQVENTANAYHRILLTLQNSPGASGIITNNIAGNAYYSNSIFANPNTGDIVSTSYRANGNNIYIGVGTASQCHQQYDATNKCLKFIFD